MWQLKGLEGGFFRMYGKQRVTGEKSVKTSESLKIRAASDACAAWFAGGPKDLFSALRAIG
jgi:hypothetical protein